MWPVLAIRGSLGGRGFVTMDALLVPVKAEFSTISLRVQFQTLGYEAPPRVLGACLAGIQTVAPTDLRPNGGGRGGESR